MQGLAIGVVSDNWRGKPSRAERSTRAITLILDKTSDPQRVTEKHRLLVFLSGSVGLLAG